MHLHLEIPILALEAWDSPLSNAKHIFEDVIDDKDEYDVPLINSDITDPVCIVITPLPEAVSVGEKFEAQAADSKFQFIMRPLDVAQILPFAWNAHGRISRVAHWNSARQIKC